MTGLLAIHTATDLCEIAYAAADGTRNLRADGPRSHSERLVLLVRDITDDDLSGIRGIALAAGPGSFTGLRIGLSTAKGLVFGLDVPMYAVSTLAALARDAGSLAGAHVVASVMRARRGELYAGIYRVDGGIARPLADDTVVTDETLADWIERSVRDADPDGILIAGPAARQIASETGLDGGAIRMLDIDPSAESVLGLSAESPDEYIVREPATFEPYYCKDFVARMPRQSIFDRLPF